MLHEVGCFCFYHLSFYWLHQVDKSKALIYNLVHFEQLMASWKARLYTKDGIYSSQTLCSWINSYHTVNRHIKISWKARLYTKDGIYSSQTLCSWINSYHMVNRHIKIGLFERTYYQQALSTINLQHVQLTHPFLQHHQGHPLTDPQRQTL